jgi:HK97 gp10 family phage protein
MKLTSSSTIKPGNWAALEAKLVPKLVQAATNGAKAVLAISQGLVPVDTGELKASGGTSVQWVGTKVVGYVTYGAYYAAYVEFGTGRRGAASAGRGPYPYKEDWPGMKAQPYVRPALDLGRQQVVDAFKSSLQV